MAAMTPMMMICERLAELNFSVILFEVDHGVWRRFCERIAEPSLLKCFLKGFAQVPPCFSESWRSVDNDGDDHIDDDDDDGDDDDD